MAVELSADVTLETLNKVCDLLPVGTEIEASIVHRIRTALIEYQNGNSHTIFDPESETYTAKNKSPRDTARDINTEFEDISRNDFSSFKLGIGKDAIIRFLDNFHYARDGGGRIVGVDTKNNSIRLIAAFLALPDINLINLKDIEEKCFAYPEAQYFQKFMQSEAVSEADINLNSLDGVYISEREEQDRYTRIALHFRMSANNAHLVVNENFQGDQSPELARRHVIKSYGWGIITDHNIFHIALRRKEGYAHTYQSLAVPSQLQQLLDDCQKVDEIQEIALQRFEKSKSYDGSSIQSARADLIKHIESNLFIFEKNANVLTFPKRTIDTKEDTGLNEDPFWGDFKSVNVAETMERNNVMDDAERQKLGQQLIHIAAYTGNASEILELLEQGAPVNYQDPETGCTLLHLIADGGSLGFYEEIKEAAHDEINYLIRDQQGHMASLYAVDNREIRDIIRNEELSAARKQGYYPGVTPLTDKKLTGPDGPGM